tara:strand:- start:37 stop:891 length:855 start_codon:yes stop_codon:yes gene_type:complete
LEIEDTYEDEMRESFADDLRESYTALLDRYTVRHREFNDTEEFIDETARRVACKKHLSRTGRYIARDQIHLDMDASDLYSAGWVAGMEAWKDWDEDREGGMGLEPYIIWHVWKTQNDTSWFRAAATIPKWIIYPLLALADLFDDQEAKRKAWIEMGHSAQTFDNVDGLLKPEQVRMEIFTNDFCNGVEMVEKPAQGAQVVDPEFEGQLRIFETVDLTPLEAKVVRYRRAGYDNSFIADTLISQDEMICKGTPKARARKVSIIYSTAMKKAQKFFLPVTEEEENA